MGNRPSKAGAYTIKLNSENRLGGGEYADVYKVIKKDTQKLYAAKFLKVPLAYIDSLEKPLYDLELQKLKEIDHPFVIKYQDEFKYKGASG
jgi:serine/threonine protein kinase